jgi:tripartite ATP-independent transporter DctP family solute receptor
MPAAGSERYEEGVMHRFQFWSSAFAIALSIAAGLGSAAPALAQTTLRINIAIAQNSHYGVAIDTFAREVEKRTNGRYKVQTFYSGALGAERESVEGVQLGTLDLTLTSTGPLPNFVPDVAILDIPFLFRDYAHARAVLDGPIGQELLAKFPPKGMIGLAWAENGFRHMTNSKHPVNQPDDLRGLKMRTMENPIHIEAYRQFGILPTPMAFTEVFTALQQGTVDGQENPLSVITSAKLDQVQKYLSLTGHVYSPAIFLMNKAQWDKLSDTDKQVFVEAAREGVKANRARVDEDERRAVADLRAKGMNVVENLDKAKFQAVLVPVYADFGKRFGQANIDRIRNYNYK